MSDDAPATAPAKPERRDGRSQHVLTVESTQWIGPHLVRVVVTGDSLADFDVAGNTDAYVKLMFADPSLEPPYDLAALRASTDPVSAVAVRTYTVRWSDPGARRIAIDFVTHGDTGVAARWAAGATPGDRVVLAGPGGAYAPDPSITWHLLAGDLAAAPAIAAALEAMPADAHGTVLIEVADEADALELASPAAVDVRWLVNPDETDTTFLARAVASADWPAEPGAPSAAQVFVHGEREAVKAVRAVLRERGVPREALSISAYWARGRTEDAFQAEKREPIGQID